MGGTPAFVFRDGARLTPWMDYQIGRLSHDMYTAFGVRVVVTSGIRTYEEQKRIFLERYVLAGDVRGRRVYDTRWWNGRLWYRISDQGTVAQPSTSNHEIQGSTAAVDIRDTGSDSGITNKNSKRGRWIRANAWRYGLVAEGDGFGEGWHFKVLAIFTAVPSKPAGGGSSKPKGVTVIQYQTQDYTCRNGGRKLNGGDAFWLTNVAKAPVTRATNIVGGIGAYSFVTHVYATGTPGDSVDVALYWDNTKTTGRHSAHYIEHVVIPADGVIRVSFPFIRKVASGYAVYAHMQATKGNKGPVTVTLFDSDALLIA